MLSIDSPCNRICTLHPRLDICVGCGRTIAEIGRWRELSLPERLALMDVVRERLAKLQASNWQPPDEAS